MERLEEFRRTTLARHIEAEKAFVHGDPRPRMELWSKRDPVTLYGAIGMSESGWEQLSQTLSWVVRRFSKVSDFRIDVELVEVSGDLAYVLWFERFNGSIAGRAVEPVTVRVTHVYRREDGEWKVVHRHADNPGNDPRSEEDEDIEATTSPLLRRPEDGQRVKGPVAQLTYKARSVETGGAMTVIQTIAAPGEGPPLHVHADDDEFICVLEGRLRVRFGEDVHEAPAGSFVFIPKGLTHTWQNRGPETARFLFGFTPASVGMERFFERSDELTGDTRLADAFSTFATDAGMEVVGPPLAESDPVGR